MILSRTKLIPHPFRAFISFKKMTSLVISSSDIDAKLVYQWLAEGHSGSPKISYVTIDENAQKTLLNLENGETITSPNSVLTYLASSVSEEFTGSPAEPSVQADVQQWLTASAVSSTELPEFSKAINSHMSGKSHIASNRPTLADIVVYSRLRSYINSIGLDEQKTILNTMRWFNQVQSLLIGNNTLTNASVEAITLDLEALNLTGKKKKEKREKAPAVKQEAAPIVPSMVDFRVGHIVEVAKHEAADSLYVEKIDLGEAEPRTIISGLVKHYTLDEMKGRYVVVIGNLKPVSMRGIKSYGMVLCATNAEGKVEFVEPPQGSKPGDRLFFEGYCGQQPEEILNPKKKIWETIQPNLSTNSERIAGWTDNNSTFCALQSTVGVCTTPTAINAELK